MMNQTSDIGIVRCGDEAANQFAFAEDYINLNHGSYGTYPLKIRSLLRQFQERVEARPDTFIRYEYRTHLLDYSRSTIAEYLHVPVQTCVLLPNATTGIDTVLRNLTFSPGDIIVYFSTVYAAFDNTMHYLSTTTSVETREISYTHPVSDDQICDILRKAFDNAAMEGKVVRLALFDTINSIPGVRMPFERLTKLCRLYNVLSCIDGAHGVGHIPLQLEELDPDFLVSNCHKWLFVPRSCAVLYVPLRNQHLLRATLPVGFDYQRHTSTEVDQKGSNFIANFASVGTLDDTPYLCIPAALEWRKFVAWGEKRGEEAIMAYNNDLAYQGGQAVATLLGTNVLENEKGTLGKCCMTNVRLPLVLNTLLETDRDLEQVANWVMRTMNLEHRIAVYVFPYASALWVRLSAQIYLSIWHFEEAGKVLLQICTRLNGQSKA